MFFNITTPYSYFTLLQSMRRQISLQGSPKTKGGKQVNGLVSLFLLRYACRLTCNSHSPFAIMKLFFRLQEAKSPSKAKRKVCLFIFMRFLQSTTFQEKHFCTCSFGNMIFGSIICSRTYYNLSVCFFVIFSQRAL